MPPFVGYLLVADQRLLGCGPDLAQVRRRSCRVDRDVDAPNRVGSGIAGAGNAFVDGHRQGDRPVRTAKSHSLGEAGRQCREQRVAGPPE